jgi:hypothetical protein
MGLFVVVTNWIPHASWDIMVYPTSSLIEGEHFITSCYEIWVIDNMATGNIVRYLKDVAYINYKKIPSELTKMLRITKWSDFLRRSPWAPYNCCQFLPSCGIFLYSCMHNTYRQSRRYVLHKNLLM